MPQAAAKRGSMPLEQPATIEMVPVGAIVVTAQLRRGVVSEECSQLGNGPRSAASRSLLRRPASLMHSPSRSTRARHSSESYGTPSPTSRSAKPITPSPIRRLARAIPVIRGSG